MKDGELAEPASQTPRKRPSHRVGKETVVYPRGEDLPYSDGVPLETQWHVLAMYLLLDQIGQHFAGREDYFAGGDMFIHYHPQKLMNKDFRGPDFFVVLGVNKQPLRKSWVVWEEGWHYPDVVVELVSKTTRRVDRVVKKQLYQDEWKTSEYFCYDPSNSRIDAWRLDAKGLYQPIEPVEGRYPSLRLGLSLGPWKGCFKSYENVWPRWFDAKGKPVPLEQEAAEAEVVALKKKLAAAKRKKS